MDSRSDPVDTRSKPVDTRSNPVDTRSNPVDTLKNISLDNIIYNINPPDILHLTDFMLEMIDKRDREICESEKYKNHFMKLTYTQESEETEYQYLECMESDGEESDYQEEMYYEETDYQEEMYYEESDYQEEREPWFDPYEDD